MRNRDTEPAIDTVIKRALRPTNRWREERQTFDHERTRERLARRYRTPYAYVEEISPVRT